MGAVNGVEEERSLKAPLHNFKLPSILNWGNQRHFRCKVPDRDSGKKIIEKCPSTTRVKRSSPVMTAEEGIDSLREKIMIDLKYATERMKLAIFNDDIHAVTAVDLSSTGNCEYLKRRSPITDDQTTADEKAKRWNLRTRKPTTMVESGGREFEDFSHLIGENCGKQVERKREKFSVSLTKKEIEEDYLKLIGHRPPRRPRKRARTVQRHLDVMFPGLWLTEVTSSIYRVPERQEVWREIE